MAKKGEAYYRYSYEELSAFACRYLCCWKQLFR